MSFRSKNALLDNFVLLSSNEFSVLCMNLGDGTQLTATNEEIVQLVVLEHKNVRVREEGFEGVDALLFCENFHFRLNFIVKVWDNDVKAVITANFRIGIFTILLVCLQY